MKKREEEIEKDLFCPAPTDVDDVVKKSNVDEVVGKGKVNAVLNKYI